MSDHEWQHSERKPGQCPACGFAPVATILYGMPAFSEEQQAAIARGEIVLGGCCISDFDPCWACSKCKITIYRTSDLRDAGMLSPRSEE